MRPDRKLVGDLKPSLVRAVFTSWFSCSNAEADLLLTLFEATEPLHIGVLRKLLGEKSRNNVEVMVWGLRKAMEAEAIDTIPGGWYVLTEIGRRECREAFANMGAVLAEKGVAA